MRAFAFAALLALLVALPSLAAAPAPKRQPASPPAQLWGKYPVGSQKLKRLPAPKPTPRPRATARTQKPPAITGGDTGGTSFPLWAVLLGALALSCVLGLAGESLVGRARRVVRPPRGYESSFPEEPAERTDDRQVPPPPSRAQPVEDDGLLSTSVGELRRSAAALGYEDPKLHAVIEAVTVSGEWRLLALATVLSSWDEPAVATLARPQDPLSQSEGGMTMGDGYADLGTRVAAVLHAAEEVAARIREKAREEAAAIRRDAEDATARVEHLTQEAEQLHTKAEKALAEAEAQARARREAAEATATQIEAEALKHQEDLNAAARSLEERLQSTLAGLERVSSNAEHVLGSSAQAAPREDGNSASEALTA